jgi:hypothetical protein
LEAEKADRLEAFQKELAQEFDEVKRQELELMEKHLTSLQGARDAIAQAQMALLRSDQAIGGTTAILQSDLCVKQQKVDNTLKAFSDDLNKADADFHSGFQAEVCFLFDKI